MVLENLSSDNSRNKILSERITIGASSANFLVKLYENISNSLSLIALLTKPIFNASFALIISPVKTNSFAFFHQLHPIKEKFLILLIILHLLQPY